MDENRLVQEVAKRVESELKGASRKIREISEMATLAISELKDMVKDEVKEGLKVYWETLGNAKAPFESGPNLSPAALSQLTYTSVAALTRQNLTHAAALTKGDSKAKQIIVERGTQGEVGAAEGLTEKELLEKAQIALQAMADNQAPVEVKFISAKIVKNGGVMYELNSERAASWLRQDAPALEFIANFGRAAVLKSKPFIIIVEFVPVGFDPTNMGDLLMIEEANELSMGAVKSAKWIKPIQRREAKQRTAHLIVNFTSVQDANRILQRGMLIAGTRVRTRKLLQDPRRCFKCHKHGVDHLATNCPQVHDMCRTCTGRHRTSECLETNPKFYKCVNCRADGHAAWSRDC
jgi:hypothetical protein